MRELADSGEIITDRQLAKKIEQLKEKPKYAFRDDDVDLIPIAQLPVYPIKMHNRISMAAGIQLQAETITVQELVEPYPSSCDNSGQLVN